MFILEIIIHTRNEKAKVYAYTIGYICMCVYVCIHAYYVCPAYGGVAFRGNRFAVNMKNEQLWTNKGGGHGEEAS